MRSQNGQKARKHKRRNAEDEWTTVIDSGKRIKGRKKAAIAEGKRGSEAPNTKNTYKKTKGKIKLPRSAAVIITPNAEKGVIRAEVMREARSKIKLEDLGIEYIRPKIAVTGAVILEIPGEAGTSKVDGLASKLREVFGEDKARVTRPVKRADLRIAGLDESVTSHELATAMATLGGCLVEECKVGEIRRGPSGLGTV